MKQKVFIRKKETLIEPVFGDKPAIDWIYKLDWDSGGCTIKDDESGLSVVIVNLASLRRDHSDSIPSVWVEHLGWEDATLEFIDFVFTHEMVHWACDGTDRENELIDAYMINGKGEKMIMSSRREHRLEP